MIGLNTLFPVAKPKLHGKQPPLDFDHIDSEAMINEVIQQGRWWRVEYRGTFWNALCIESTPLMPGDTVYVLGNHSATTLIISPVWLGA
jgi:membrane protein implicated in regulation of membrane protease activity